MSALPTFDLTDKVALITGGTRGIGLAIAETFAAAGAKVVVASRKQENVDAAVARIREAGGEILGVAAHTGSQESVTALVARTIETFGGVDILVNNAAANPHFGPLLTAEESHWDKILDVNVKGYFRMIKTCVPLMQKRGGGVILVNGSIAAWKEFPNHPAYCASKAALVALVKQVALDYGPTIRANILCPGQVDTPLLWESTKAFPNPEEVVAQVVEEHIVLKKIV
jgi:NAD(P)-dependent dehydrogenase (short-subunit alcohol dehydrogenase family)